jgi:hypothetical protein
MSNRVLMALLDCRRGRDDAHGQIPVAIVCRDWPCACPGWLGERLHLDRHKASPYRRWPVDCVQLHHRVPTTGRRHAFL